MSSRNSTTFGMALGYNRDPYTSWYARLRETLSFVRNAAAYKMHEEKNKNSFRALLNKVSADSSKNMTRQEIVNVYEIIVTALMTELTALEESLYESSEVVKKQDAELNRLRDMNRDMGHREMKAHDQANIAKRKTEALLTLIAETTKDQATVDEYGNVITPTGGWS